MNQKTALLGGTFDPPHLGHFELAKNLAQDERFQKIFIIPSRIPSLKNAPLASYSHRREMCKIQFSSLPKMKLWEERERTTPTTTWDQLQELKQEGHQNLSVVLGDDQILKLDQWYRFPELLRSTHWTFIKREGLDETLVQEKIRSFKSSFEFVEGKNYWRLSYKLPEISSSLIRHKMQTKEPLGDQILAPQIMEYLKQTTLYGTSFTL